MNQFTLSKPPFACFVLTLFFIQLSFSQGFEGYYRYPDVHGDKIIFTAEGDLWTVNLRGGIAQRLTTHSEEEAFPIFSPDGNTIAFSANYEGPTEVYSMPITGGIPIRWTYESDFSMTNCWTPDGKIVYDTRAYSTLPDRQLVTINLKDRSKTRIPLSQASEASFDATGRTVFFVRPSYHYNVTKRYQGGTARQIWKFTEGTPEAIKLTNNYKGESFKPMWYNQRIYFISDRDGMMNIWSMDEAGNDLKQHTKHEDFDVRYANVSQGNIVYQKGADIYHYSIQNNEAKKVEIRLNSDLDQLREKWEDDPSDYITSIHPDFNGDKIVITARGKVFVAPVKSGRIVNFTSKSNVRYRDAVFHPKDKDVLALSDESGEFEFVSLPGDGIGSEKQITKDGKILRYKGVPSPDGKWLAYDDLANQMYLLNLSNGVSKKISNNEEGIYSFSWSPDSKWIAFVEVADNTMAQIFLYHNDSGEKFPITTDRANSLSPQWSPDGKFIYFLSDRNFNTLVGSPWGPRQPEPYFDASEKLYHIPLQKNTRSPFMPNDELQKEEKKDKDDNEKSVPKVIIDRIGISERISEVPIEPGNYSALQISSEAIYLLTKDTGVNAKSHLKVVKIDKDDIKLKTMVSDISSFELSGNGKKILIRKKTKNYLVEAGTSEISDLTDDAINLTNWKFPINPKEDWQQIFTDAWRMERDYFYDQNMHGVNWDAMHDKYYPLVDRVTTREELSDLIGRFVGELSALHTSVRGGDIREDKNDISVPSLGAIFSRSEKLDGYQIEYIFKGDPDYPDEKSPLDNPYHSIEIGDVISKINGSPTISSSDIGELLRNQEGKQVRLTIKQGATSKDIIVEPIKDIYSLRYRDWEFTRRLKVEKETDNRVGYVHLRAMGSSDLNQWYREFYPVFDRPGLIIDVRHNRGGNIESFILEKLLRKAWMYWKSRSGKPYWNMQYAFRGHIVILVDENTASDGEAFADGFKKLNLGTAIGKRTWGGEIWLSGANTLSDGGIARAPMMGVYDEKGNWLIEGHGFEPDIEVDNLPHATFKGEDAQLDAAIEHLKKLIEKDPRSVPDPPKYPNKSFKNNQ